jgi:tetratricopeptide (TPR) repeat protein
MATVFLATDLRHDRPVALKVLKPDLGAIVGAERFLREIKTTAQLSHPHILPLFDSGSAGDLLYYVMPYVEGETLADRIARDGPLPAADAQRIGAEVLEALAYAHRQGFVHRDIKPSNILLSAATGHALVADFGIARAISSADFDAITRPGVILGTPAYMAPEQATSEDITPAADIYSTGLVLYECLTGRRFPPPVLRHDADWSAVPPGERGVLQRALSPAPGDRWADAAAFRAALLHRAGGLRPRWPLAVAALALALLGAALVPLLRTSAPEPTTDHRLAVLPFTVRGSGGLEYLRDGMVDLLSAKLDGAGTWRMSDPRAVLSLVRRDLGDAVPDPDAGRRVARRIDATHFVLGDILEVGRQIRLSAALYGVDEGRDVLAQASVEGDSADVLALLDAMAAELLSAYGSGADTRLSQIALMTSQSLPALKSYLRGVRALRAAEFPAAAEALEDAIGADSAFALAWYQLSITADWLQRSDLAREAADQAVRFAARLPERERRLLEALRTVRAGDVDAGEQQLRTILGTHPDDIEAWSQLAELLFHFGPHHGRPLSASRDAWHHLIALEPGWAAAYVHLARIAAAEGDLRALDTLSRAALALAPAGDRGLEMRALRLALDPDAGAREGVVQGLRDAPDDVVGEVFWSTGTFLRDRAVALMVLDVATEPRRSRELRTVGFGGRAAIEARHGRRRVARAAVDSMMGLDPVRGLAQGALLALAPALDGDLGPLRAYRDRLARADWTAVPPSVNRASWFSALDGIHPYVRWFLLGMAAALSGDEPAARVFADSLARVRPPVGTGSLVPDFAETVRAAAAWRGGRLGDALAALDRLRFQVWYQVATGGMSQGFSRFLYARVLEDAGRTREALDWYETFANAGPEDAAYIAPAHVRRARLLASLGDVEGARAQYEAFLAMWAEADPEMEPIVTAARDAARQLAGREPR